MDAVDLRAYFPEQAQHVYRKADGTAKSRFTFQKSPCPMDALYTGYYDINKPGYTYMWRKEYMANGAWCTATYAVLRMGDDKSVTEVGDWFSGAPCTPNSLFGYKTPLWINTGLLWSGPGGLSDVPVINEVDIWRQNTPGAAYANSGHKAYSKAGLIEHLPDYTVPYGWNESGIWAAGYGKTYSNVIHIVMYHGTRIPNGTSIRCVGPVSANGVYYQSYKDYNTYAIELWLAEGVGIIQDNTPFIEDAAFWGMTNCTGDIFQYPGQWATYIDE